MNPDPFAWTPRDGDVVHFRAIERHETPSGRYRLEKQPGELNSSFWLRGVTVVGNASATVAELARLERAGRITPIDEDRERYELELRSRAPLRQARCREMMPQHDASDLALFRAANEPRMI